MALTTQKVNKTEPGYICTIASNKLILAQAISKSRGTALHLCLERYAKSQGNRVL